MPSMPWQAVLDAAPDVLLLMPCGLPPERTLAEIGVLTERPGWSDLPAVQAGEVWVLDGPAYFNRPGGIGDHACDGRCAHLRPGSKRTQ